MKPKKEEQLDNFIRSKIQGLGKFEYRIEPSPGFTRQVMVKIGLINRRQRWLGYLFAAILSITPLALRAFWLLIRRDYFSVSSMPMGHLILLAYKFFISPSALFVLLAFGILAFLLRANKLRRGLNSFPIKIA